MGRCDHNMNVLLPRKYHGCYDQARENCQRQQCTTGPPLTVMPPRLAIRAHDATLCRRCHAVPHVAGRLKSKVRYLVPACKRLSRYKSPVPRSHLVWCISTARHLCGGIVAI